MKNLIIVTVLVFQIAHSVAGQRVEISNAKVVGRSLEVEFVFENSASTDAFIPGNSSDPAGPNYFLSTNEKSKTLIVQRQLFLFPHEVITDLVEPCYDLRTVKAGEVYHERIAIVFPSATNIFP